MTCPRHRHRHRHGPASRPAPRARAAAALAGLAVAAAGCIRAPDVVVVDRRTALEAEAAGRFADLELALERQAIAPEPLPLSRAQLEAAGWRSAATDDAIAKMEAPLRASADRTDDLLRRRCVGEALDGRLVATMARCAGAVDPGEVAALVERTQRARLQIWAWLQRQAPGASAEAVRASWRRRHLQRLVCGAHVEFDAGRWGDKPCP